MFAFNYYKDSEITELIQPVKPSERPIYGKPSEKYIDHWGQAYIRSTESPERLMQSDAYLSKSVVYLEEEDKHLNLVDERGDGDFDNMPFTVHSDVAYYVNFQANNLEELDEQDLVDEFLSVSNDVMLDEGIHLFGLLQELLVVAERNQRTNVLAIREQIEYLGATEMVMEIIKSQYAMKVLNEHYEIA